jgi:hypothetical protein
MTEASATNTDADPDADRQIETFTLIWQGITLEITWEPCWLSLCFSADYEKAHLVVRSVAPDCAPLPITGTGYRSHFTTRAAMEAAGGPVAFVQAWLDEAARAPAWQSHVAASRQPSLFEL